jgi:hypothetical protein
VMDKHRRAVIGGKAGAATNRLYHLRKIVGHDEIGREILECGHVQSVRQDLAGEYPADRRRCIGCPKASA